MLDEWDHKLRRAPFGTEPVSRPVGVDRFPSDPRDADPRPDLSVRAVGGLTVVDFVNAEVLFEERTIRELSARLQRLVEGGHTRLLLNLNSVRYASSSVVALLARLYRRVN